MNQTTNKPFDDLYIPFRFHLHGSKMNIVMIQCPWVIVWDLLDTYLNYTWSSPMKSFAVLWDGPVLVQSILTQTIYKICTLHAVQRFLSLYLLWLCNILNILSNYSFVTFKQTSLWVLWMLSIINTTFEKFITIKYTI